MPVIKIKPIPNRTLDLAPVADRRPHETCVCQKEWQASFSALDLFGASTFRNDHLSGWKVKHFSCTDFADDNGDIGDVDDDIG